MRKRYLVAVALFLFFLCGSSLAVFAMNTGLETEIAPEEKFEEMQADIKFITEEPKKESFSCFAVNEEGRIAIAFRKMHGTIKVRVYDKNGNFQYGYNTDFEQGVDIEWDGNNLLLYLARSSYAISINEKGEVQEVRCILNTIENNSYIYNLSRSKYNIDTEKYVARGPLGAISTLTESYSQIIVTDAQGEENTIYNASQNWLLRALIVLLVVIAIIVTVIIGLIRMVKRISAQNAQYSFSYVPSAPSEGNQIPPASFEGSSNHPFNDDKKQ